MITILQAQELMNGAAFLKRVTFATIKSAMNVCGENVNTANHAGRLARARLVLANPGNFAAMYAQGVVASMNLNSQQMNGQGDCDLTDAQILVLVGQIWDWYS